MTGNVLGAIEQNPIIAAVKNETGLEQVLSRDNRVVFLLYGDVCGLPGTVERLHQAGKLAVVHTDLITGLAPREVAVDYVSSVAYADGVITTRPNLIRRGRELGLFTILRFFVFDSLSLENVRPAAMSAQPDMVEILPGIMPKVIARVADSLPIPLICGGLVMDKSDVMEALSAGALAVSSTNQAVWKL